MSADPRPLGEDDLQAWIDGRLSPDRTAVVVAYFDAHPEAAQKAAADRSAAVLMREALASVADEPIPARLRVANIVAGRRNRWQIRVGAVAASLAWVVLGGAAGWFGRDLLPDGMRGGEIAAASMPSRAAAAAFRTYTVEIAHAVEVGADQKPHLVQWLSRRLDRPVVVPDLSEQGYRLMGGRLLPTDGSPAALLMYDDESGKRLIVYTRGSRGGDAPRSAFRSARDGDVTSFDWTDAGQSYVVTARSQADRLRSVAEAVDDQVRRPDAKKF